MAEHKRGGVEQDPRFPSGPWTGFFLQHWLPGRHPTHLHLTCRDGRLMGTGHDWVGAYTVDGHYDLATGRCEWVKQYLGKHSVSYRGVNDGNGIWGTWEIRQLGGAYVDRGGFHLWPEGTDVSEESERTEQAVLAVMRQEFGTRRPGALLGALVLGAAVALGLLLWWGWHSTP
jgi:hypothetical protein